MQEQAALRAYSAGVWPAVAAAALALGLYAITLRGTYIYDDEYIILRDQRVHEPGQWVRLLKERYNPSAPDPLFRPITSLSYAAQWHLHGDRAWAFHLVNVLLHAAASALVAVLAARMTQNRAVALAAGLIFAAHPVHVEAVAGIVGRAEELCALGIVGGLVLFYGQHLTIGRACAITGCFVLAVLSKEHGIVLPPMLLGIYVVRRYFGREPPPSPAQRRGYLWLFMLLSFSVCGYIVHHERVASLAWEHAHLHWSVNPVVRSRGIDRLLVPVSIVGRYVELLVAPLRLSPDYGAAVTDYRMNWHDPYWYIGAAAIVAFVAALALAIRRRAGVVVGCLLCLAVAYGMIGNMLYIIGTVMGERLIYIASVFVVILVAMAIARLPRFAFGACLGVVLALAAVRTVSYAYQWNDALRLFAYGVRSQPKSVYLRVLEANELVKRGRLDEAEPLLAAARQLGPEVVSAGQLSAQVAELQGRPADASAYHERAMMLTLHPPQMDRQPPPRTRPAGSAGVTRKGG